MASPPQKPQQGPPQTPRNLWIWWLIFGGLLIWNLVSFWPQARPEVVLPYSTFLAQVRADNITKVHIAGDDITGAFVKPLVWPSPAPGVAPATSPESRTSPVKPPASKAPPAAPAEQAPPAPKPYADFRTTFPQAVGDPTLMPLLQAHKVVIEVSSPPTNWLAFMLIEGLPALLLIGFFVWMGRRAAANQGGMFTFGRSKARRYSREQPRVTFTDVAGAEEAKADLQQEVDFLRHPQKYHALGARIPRGVLLVGPQGTGKTLLGRAVAGEAGVSFFSISGSEFVEIFVGVGASRVRDLFEQAKAAAPAIVFIDELDAVGRRRGAGVGNVNDEREQTLNQLLVEMDGFDARQEVIVLAATNRPDVLDPALLRPGRFDRQVTVPLPDRPGREAILCIHTRPLRLAPEWTCRCWPAPPPASAARIWPTCVTKRPSSPPTTTTVR